MSVNGQWTLSVNGPRRQKSFTGWGLESQLETPEMFCNLLLRDIILNWYQRLMQAPGQILSVCKPDSPIQHSATNSFPLQLWHNAHFAWTSKLKAFFGFLSPSSNSPSPVFAAIRARVATTFANFDSDFQRWEKNNTTNFRVRKIPPLLVFQGEFDLRASECVPTILLWPYCNMIFLKKVTLKLTAHLACLENRNIMGLNSKWLPQPS